MSDSPKDFENEHVYEKLTDEELLAKFGLYSRAVGRSGLKNGIGHRTITEIGVDEYSKHMALVVRAHIMQELLEQRFKSGRKVLKAALLANAKPG